MCYVYVGVEVTYTYNTGNLAKILYVYDCVFEYGAICGNKILCLYFFFL